MSSKAKPSSSFIDKLNDHFDAERPMLALLMLRLGFFTLLAYDLWTISLSHAPRYGAGDFNVAHFDVLSNLGVIPTPSSIGALYLVSGVLALWIAFGYVGKLGLIFCTSLYSFAYFWSQADSYQHHYLLCLILVLLIGEPWRARKSLALKALMWQMSLIYAWTAVAKCESVWLSGETLNKLVNTPDVRQSIESTGALLGLGVQETFKYSAWAVMLGEFFAAFAFIFKPLRPFAFFIVPWFHIMVEWIGFDIELFSYYMILLNIALLSPAFLWHKLDQYCSAIFSQTGPTQIVESKPQQTFIFAVCMALICGLLSAWSIYTVDFEGSQIGSKFAFGLVGLSVFHFINVGHFQTLNSLFSKLFFLSSLCMALWTHHFLVSEIQKPSFRFDYYRMWGGDLKRRGLDQEALTIYEKANQAQEMDLTARFIPAGELAIKLGQTERGLSYLKEGANRRLIDLERKIQNLLDPTQTKNKQQLSQEVERAGMAASQAQNKLYRAYLSQRDQRAQEAEAQIQMIQQMIQQARSYQ